MSPSMITPPSIQKVINTITSGDNALKKLTQFEKLRKKLPDDAYWSVLRNIIQWPLPDNGSGMLRRFILSERQNILKHFCSAYEVDTLQSKNMELTLYSMSPPNDSLLFSDSPSDLLKLTPDTSANFMYQLKVLKCNINAPITINGIIYFIVCDQTKINIIKTIPLY